MFFFGRKTATSTYVVRLRLRLDCLFFLFFFPSRRKIFRKTTVNGRAGSDVFFLRSSRAKFARPRRDDGSDALRAERFTTLECRSIECENDVRCEVDTIKV